MACRLEEIPKPGDFVEYEILDQSVIVVRVDDSTVRAYYNSCRHRGMKLVEGSGSRRSIVCPFHGWCWGLDGKNTFVLRSEEFDESNLCADDLALAPVRCELWGGCAWINLDDSAPPLRDCIEPFASRHDEWKVGALRTEWWKSCLLPVNWKLATAAFMEGYHVPQTHPQLLPSAHSPESSSVHPLIQTSLHFMRTLGSGMGGMTHENDIRIAEGLQHMSLPDDPAEAMATWRRAVNEAVTEWHRARDCDFPDLNDLERRGVIDPIGFCFPHYFILPQYSSASSYRIRPLGPEQTLFEVWSLTRYPNDQSPGRPTPPEPLAPDDPSWPMIPAQDFSNLPKQQKGLHAKGFEYMRLSDQIEGLISNFERVIDGFLAGLPYERLVPAIQKTNTTIDVPVADLGMTKKFPRHEVGQVVDLLIAGSGGGGMVAALAALDSGIEPLVVEKQALVGGSTGMSGGMVWLPNNPLMRADGIPDSHEDGLAYFDDVVGDIGPPSSPARREMFLTAGFEMINFLTRKGVRLVRCPGYSDYYPNHKGGNAAGRSVEGIPFDAAELGDWSERVQPSMAKKSGFVVKTNELQRSVLYFNRSPRTFAVALRVILRTKIAEIRRRDLMTNGASLIGQMLKVLIDAGGEPPVWMNTAMEDLIVSEGRVVGARINRDGTVLNIQARKGVLLAAGGFARNADMRRRYSGDQPNEAKWSIANAGDTGEVLQTAMRLGAKTDLLDEAWWYPMVFLADPSAASLGSGRQRPGAIYVDSTGKRFCNESNSYVEVGKAMYANKAVPCWLVFDEGYVGRYVSGANPLKKRPLPED